MRLQKWWTHGAAKWHSLSSASIDGGDPVDRISGPAGLVSIALDDTSIYWANSNDVAVMVMPK
jgi:hypothetical protein